MLAFQRNQPERRITMIEYLVLAVAPGIFWLWFFWRKDKFEREPASYIVRTFLLGAAVVLPAAFIENFLSVGEGVTDMMIVGVVEELGKFLAVYLYVYRKSEFNEVMDGIIYSAAASLGFASLENLFYIMEFGPGVIVGRAILSTLGHVLFASFWGYALGLKKITGKNTVFTGLILSMAAHGIYNALLTTEFLLSAVLVIVFMIILYRSMSGKIKKSLAMSPFTTTEDSRTGAVCPQCGNTLPEHSTYCPNCGRKI